MNFRKNIRTRVAIFPELHEVFNKFHRIVTVEDGCITGGFGSAIIEFMADNNYSSQVVRLGIPDEVIQHGEPNELHAECEYNADSIAKAAIKLIEPALK